MMNGSPKNILEMDQRSQRDYISHISNEELKELISQGEKNLQEMKVQIDWLNEKIKKIEPTNISTYDQLLEILEDEKPKEEIIVIEKPLNNKNKKNDTILKTVGGLMMIGGILRWMESSTLFKPKPTYKQRGKNEQIDSSKIDPIQIDDTDTLKITPEELAPIVPLDSLTLDTTKTLVSLGQMEAGVTHEQIQSIINAIPDKDIRIQVIDFLQQGKIFKAQEIYGMKQQSNYRSNRASNIIDKYTLENFSDPLFNISGDDLLKSAEIPQDVKDAYLGFLNGTYFNNGENFIIISKTNDMLYLFTKEFTLLNHQKVLLGKKKGDTPFKIHTNPTTPAGLYTMARIDRESDGSGIRFTPGYMMEGKRNEEEGPGGLLDLLPIDLETKTMIPPQKGDGSMAIHATPSHMISERTKKIESESISDDRDTGGCINASFRSRIKDNTEKRTMVFITPEK